MESDLEEVADTQIARALIAMAMRLPQAPEARIDQFTHSGL
jgi:hypothetical protein